MSPRKWTVLFFLAVALAGLLWPLLGQNVPTLRIREEESREHFRRGLTFFNAGQYTAAREFFYKALNRVAYFHLARRYLGDAHYYSGEWNSALEQWEFLDKNSEGAYPLIRMRSDLLRFQLNGFRNAGPYIHFKAYGPQDFGGYVVRRPVDTAVDRESNVYYLFGESANVIQANAGQTMFHQFRGRIFDRLKTPAAMALYGTELFIADYAEDRVRAFDTSGSEVLSFGGNGGKDGELRGPAAVLVTEHAIYVSDSGNRRIQKFDRSGKFLLKFIPTEAFTPAGLAWHDGRIYAADRAGRIVLFDEDGNYLEQMESPLLKSPRGISTDKTRLIVADETSGVLFYDFAEKAWSKLEVRTSEDSELIWNRPFSARVDTNGMLYVSEAGSGRVHVLMPESLRISNLECRLERVDTASFPDVALFFRAKNRLGNPLTGLTRREIRIYENDRLLRGINTANMEPYQNRTNLVLVQEESPFFAEEENRRILESVISSLIAPIRISDRIRVLRASEGPRMVYEGLQRRAIVRAMSEGEHVKNPATGKAMFDGISHLVTGLGPRALVLFSAGDNPEIFRQYPRDRIEYYARAHGIPIFVISFSGEGPEELKGLAEASGGGLIKAYDQKKMQALYEQIRGEKDSRYVLTYRSQITQDLTGRYIDVRVDVDHQGMTGAAEGGYFVPGSE